MTIVIVTLAIAYVSIGVGIALRLGQNVRISEIPKVVFVSPAVGLFFAIMVFFKAYKNIKNDAKIKKNVLIKFILTFRCWALYIPTIVTTIAIVSIVDSRGIKNKYRRTRNNCADVVHERLCSMAV